ncbi:MAG TPA: DUF1501 domain-containing protein [Pirellulales bacterium]|jgi:uncharacterized protein (DUF1501 family)|nr:DUF1501 domain-containing protein [Pirellulales bacterium]
MFNCNCPSGMTRRHFMTHLAGTAALASPAIAFTNTLLANAVDMKRKNKACIMLWMGGGPATIDMWDMKPGSPTAGAFKPISTKVDGLQICEHLPQLAKQMDQLAVIRSMSTREADHGRGRYYMHTGYVPNPTIDHPSYGAVVAHELADKMPHLDIPPFVSVGSDSIGPGFLGMTWAPFVVDANGDVKNLNNGGNMDRMNERLTVLEAMDHQFMFENRGEAADDHMKVTKKAVSLMTSKQMAAFKAAQEPPDVQERYGKTGFGKGCLMARRLVEAGVPFVEVDMGGWDTHSNNFTTLEKTKLPELDKAMSALITDLKDRGLYDSTAIMWLGEFGRTPRINGNAGRDHYARAWSVVVGGGSFKRGVIVGATNEDGTQVTSDPYTSQDLMASVLKSLGISLDTTFTSNSGRPMKIANSGKVIKELFA